MTNEVQPLLALLAQVERERDLALADQQKATAQSRAADTQAEQLLGYRREHEQRWRTQFAQQGQIALVRCYQGFTERLTQAVDAQQRTAAQARAQLERAGSVVRERELRVAAVRQLVERRLDEARRRAERIDQKQNDELAARIAWRQRATG